jgi:hypothetical protein
MRMPIEMVWGELLRNAPFVGTIAALISAILVKMVDSHVSKRKSDVDEATQIRSELRSDLNRFKDRLDDCFAETERLRALYWAEVSAHAETKLIIAKFPQEYMDTIEDELGKGSE